MMEGVMKSLFAMMNVDPIEAGDMVRKTVASVSAVNERLARIEQALRIYDIQPVSDFDEKMRKGYAEDDKGIQG